MIDLGAAVQRPQAIPDNFLLRDHSLQVEVSVPTRMFPLV